MTNVGESFQILCLLSGTGVSFLRFPTCNTTSHEGSKPYHLYVSRVIQNIPFYASWEVVLHVGNLRNMWPNHFRSYVFYRGPVCQFCDSPHVVRLLTRDQKVWFESLGRRKDGMVLIPREMSHYEWVIAETLSMWLLSSRILSVLLETGVSFLR